MASNTEKTTPTAAPVATGGARVDRTDALARPVAPGATAGRTVIADEQYLLDSILQPKKDITAGYPDNIMPTYQGQLGEEEVMQLIAYIKALGSNPGGVP